MLAGAKAKFAMVTPFVFVAAGGTVFAVVTLP
jgi:hypothetical protein